MFLLQSFTASIYSSIFIETEGVTNFSVRVTTHSCNGMSNAEDLKHWQNSQENTCARDSF